MPGNGHQGRVRRLGPDHAHRVAGDVRPDELLHHVEELGRAPESREGGPHPLAPVDEGGGVRPLLLEGREPRVDVLPFVPVRDPAALIELVRPDVHHVREVVEHRCELLVGEDGLDDEESVLEVALDLFLGETHRFSLSRCRPGRTCHAGSAVSTREPERRVAPGNKRSQGHFTPEEVKPLSPGRGVWGEGRPSIGPLAGDSSTSAPSPSAPLPRGEGEKARYPPIPGQREWPCKRSAARLPAGRAPVSLGPATKPGRPLHGRRFAASADSEAS